MPAEFDIVAAENRRLAREVKELHARVGAFEASRWCRPHPRFIVRRLGTPFATRAWHIGAEDSGSFEGMPACYFLWRLPDTHVTCSDTFSGGPSFAARGADVGAALSWQLLAPSGYLIFDNYVWRSPLGEDPFFHAAPAADAFVSLVGDHCEVSHEADEVFVRRVGMPAPVSAPA
jgi:hypothetical protein